GRGRAGDAFGGTLSRGEAETTTRPTLAPWPRGEFLARRRGCEPFAGALLDGLQMIGRVGITPARAYFRARIHSTSVLRSASATLSGGIGIVPQVPLPPLLTFCASFAGAEASPAYLAATSLYAGPTSFLSTVWQPWQLYFVRS